MGDRSETDGPVGGRERHEGARRLGVLLGTQRVADLPGDASDVAPGGSERSI